MASWIRGTPRTFRAFAAVLIGIGAVITGTVPGSTLAQQAAEDWSHIRTDLETTFNHRNALAVDNTKGWVYVVSHATDHDVGTIMTVTKYTPDTPDDPNDSTQCDMRVCWIVSYGKDQTEINGEHYGVAVAPQVLGNSDIFVTGVQPDGSGGTSIVVMRIDDATGQIQWTKVWDNDGNLGSYDDPVDISADGLIIVGATTESPVTGSSFGDDFLTLVFDPDDGELQDFDLFNRGSADRMVDIQSFAVNEATTEWPTDPEDLGLLVTGHTLTTGTGQDYTTICYEFPFNSTTGKYEIDRRWVRHYEGVLTDVPARVKVYNGKAVVTGYSDSGESGTRDYLTVAYRLTTGSDDGDDAWDEPLFYDGPGSGTDTARDLAVGPSNDDEPLFMAFVTGSVAGSGTGSDYGTIGIRLADGVLLWDRQYRRAESSSAADIAYAMDFYIGGNSDLYVTGQTSNGTNTDITTVRLSASSLDTLGGVPQWSQPGGDVAIHFDGGMADSPYAIALDDWFPADDEDDAQLNFSVFGRSGTSLGQTSNGARAVRYHEE